MTFAEKLRRLRADAGLSQSQLAVAAGVSLDTLQDYEQERRRFHPRLEFACALARGLGVSVVVFEACCQAEKPKKGK